MKLKNFVRNTFFYKKRDENGYQRIENLELENKILKQNLEQERKVSKSIFNSIPDTIILLNKEGVYLNFISVNEDLLVAPSSELLGKKIRDVIPYNQAITFEKAINDCIELGEIKQIEYELLVHNQVKYFEGRIIPLTDAECLFVIRDTTQNILKNKQITDKDNWFKTIFNASRDGFAVELNEKIVYVNDAFVKLYGYSNENELIGQNISLVQDPAFDFMMKEYGIKRLKGEPVPEVYESKGICKNGEIIDVEVTASVFEVNGEKFIIDTNRNISERKNFERKLKEQNEELQKTNKELDRFVYSASHDLKAPLRSILGLINLSRLESTEKIKNEYLDRMEKSINNLDKFIQDIINYSRNTRIEIIYEKFNFYYFVNDILEGLKYDINKRIPVYINYEKNFEIEVDKSRLYIILSNILSNAYRYHNPNITDSYIKINISYANENLVLSISDNGIGIPKDQLGKIFEMFYRANTNKSGSGLGLYIVIETIQKIGGTIDVNSELGLGTEFIVTLPTKPVKISS